MVLVTLQFVGSGRSWIFNDLTNPEGSFLGGAFGGGMGSGMEGDEDPQHNKHNMVAICINLWYQKVSVRRFEKLI